MFMSGVIIRYKNLTILLRNCYNASIILLIKIFVCFIVKIIFHSQLSTIHLHQFLFASFQIFYVLIYLSSFRFTSH